MQRWCEISGELIKQENLSVRRRIHKIVPSIRIAKHHAKTSKAKTKITAHQTVGMVRKCGMKAKPDRTCEPSQSQDGAADAPGRARNAR